MVVVLGILGAVAVHFLIATRDGAVTLADLSVFQSSAGRIDGWLGTMRQSLDGIGIELVLYGILTLIGLLLVVRAVASVIVVYRQRKYMGQRFSGLLQESPLGLPTNTSPLPPNGARGRWMFLSRGLSGRMFVAFTGIVALLGICTAAVVYSTLTRSMREHQLKRATVLALNVSDTAAPYLVQKKAKALPLLLRKSAADKATAYIIVADRKGAIVAHSLAELPDELQTSHDDRATQSLERRDLTLGSQRVYEVAVPVLDGQAGRVRVGLWADQVEAENRRVVAPVMIWILAVVVAGLLSSIYFVWRINRPILRLVRIASHISHGELDFPLGGTRAGGEFGELSRSLERMRSSVKAAMTRLS